MASKPRTMAEFRAYEQRQPRHVEHSELIYLMYELSRMISVNFDRVMERHRLTHSQWWAMMHIYENEGTTQSALAARMQLGRASAGSVIERLEAKGWVERRPDPEDNRVRRVYLGDAAVPVIEVMFEEGETLFKTWLGGITPNAEATVLRTLRRIKKDGESAA